MFEALLETLPKDHGIAAVAADKAYDSNDIRGRLAEEGMEAVIPSKANRKETIPHDEEKYKERNKVERFFNKLKWFRRIATRYDKLKCTFDAAVKIVAAFILSRQIVAK